MHLEEEKPLRTMGMIGGQVMAAMKPALWTPSRNHCSSTMVIPSAVAMVMENFPASPG